MSYSVGGLILDKTVTNPNFAGIAVFTPVINGEQLEHIYLSDPGETCVAFRDNQCHYAKQLMNKYREASVCLKLFAHPSVLITVRVSNVQRCLPDQACL